MNDAIQTLVLLSVVFILAGCFSCESRPPLPKVTISKRTTFLTGPLRADGYVDYIAAVNEAARKGITPENNAAVLLWQAFGPARIPEHVRERFFELLDIPPLADEGDYFVGLDRFRPAGGKGADWSSDDSNPEAEAARRPWSRDEFPAIARWLTDNEKPLSLVIAATERPKFYSPLLDPHETPLLMGTLLLAVDNSRPTAQALAARAMLRVNEGKIEEAWQDLLACHRLGRLVSQGPTLVQRLAGGKICAVVCRAEAALAHNGRLTADQAERFSAELGALPPLPSLAERLDTVNRLMILDALSLVARGGPGALNRALSGFGEVEDPEEWLDGVDIDWNEAFRVINTWFGRGVAAVTRPTRAERRAEVTKWTDDVTRLERQLKAGNRKSRFSSGSPRMLGRLMGEIHVSLGMPSLAAILDADDRDAVWLLLSRTALALAAYRADEGEYPDEIEVLCQKYLAEVPHDLFAGAPFRYQKQGSGYLLYSVGLNGKDDGGRDVDSADDLVVQAPGEPE
ncbi:MAG: hypothetical protein ACYTG0_28540 [Planctomycetota bacterium]|jgi:hypothetical protein